MSAARRSLTELSSEEAPTVLRAVACAKLGIPDHPATVHTTVTRTPRTGQYFITVLEITEGPLRVHLLKVDKTGRVLVHRTK